jgi:carboxyl-terminal processing protease
MQLQKAVRGLALALCAFLGGASAVWLMGAVSGQGGATYRELDIFTRVLANIENNYVEPVDEQKLLYGAIKGMMSTLDPHSIFMEPKQYAELKTATTGDFGGVGIDLTLRDGVVTVVSPIDDTPAARAGVMPEDQIVAIDGTPTHDMPLGTAVQKLHGSPGSKVVLLLMRKGFTQPREIALLREHLRDNPVDYRIYDDTLAYVRIRSFQDRTDRALKSALDKMRTQSGGNLSGVVLDLRNNPGGLLEQAVLVSDRFLTDGLIVTTEGRNRQHIEKESAHPRDTEPSYPMIVLVNAGSASASEIVAGALQDHGRAVIMGTQTFGKGSVQTVIDLEDGSGLKLTVAKYYTPKHRSIQEEGITPDVVVHQAATPGESESGATRERDLPNHLLHEGAGASAPPPKPAVVATAPAAPSQTDFQLQTALDYLRTWKIFRAEAKVQ